MLKKLFSFAHSFMPSGSLTQQSTMRHLTIISSIGGIPGRIEWDLNDLKSIAAAQDIMSNLYYHGGPRLYFTESTPGTLGKHLKNGPNIEEDMITIPTVVGG